LAFHAQKATWRPGCNRGALKLHTSRHTFEDHIKDKGGKEEEGRAESISGRDVDWKGRAKSKDGKARVEKTRGENAEETQNWAKKGKAWPQHDGLVGSISTCLIVGFKNVYHHSHFFT